MKKLHLLCNAHLDPYWMWEWEEGAAEAVSTFRTAAECCEEFEGFVFNHNEVILYQWVEEFAPELFARIQGLVKQGKWRIMGGWYVQPDCNMPCAESFVRHCLIGKRYFLEKFGVEPTTAINFDPFGHSRGLVQILRKAGYDSYIHCRPDQEDCSLPDNDYLWVGFDGSTVHGHRSIGWYGTPAHGMVRKKLEDYLKDHSHRELGLMLWGVGNHGGGPSKEDLATVNEIIAGNDAFPIEHSWTERYFAEARETGIDLPRHEGDLNAWAAGCYTSQTQLKQLHRQLENEIYATEKMAANATLQGRMAWPREALAAALHDLLLAQFHDILPGSSVQGVETAGCRLLYHGLEEMSRVKARAFFALAQGQPKAQEGRIPILAYNPHPFPVDGVFECEFALPDVNLGESFTLPQVWQNGKRLACQTEQEEANLNADWRKKCLFRAQLAPSQMSRFDCTVDEVAPSRPSPQLEIEGRRLEFSNGRLRVVLNATTGLLDEYAVDGFPFLRPNAMLPLVMNDDEDPWSMQVKHFRAVAGHFAPMSLADAPRFAGVKADTLAPVRVIEDGPVRTVIEVLMAYGDSFLVMHYKLPKEGTEVEVELRVYWNEKSKLLKLAVPVALTAPEYWGQVVAGRDRLPGEAREVVAQKWTAALSPADGKAFTCVNAGTYGSDFPENEMRLTLLRSPAYAGHPIEERPIVPQDRFRPRIDQGERRFHFWFNGGESAARMDAIDHEALAHNEAPMLLSFFPGGDGAPVAPGVVLSDPAVQLQAWKEAEDGGACILRLLEPTGTPRETTLHIPALGFETTVALGAFELKTLRIDLETATCEETDLLER